MSNLCRRTKHYGITALVVLCFPAFTESGAQPSADSLRAISERGRMLWEYDKAAWHATDAVAPLVKDPWAVAGYVAQPTPEGWVVSFGLPSTAADTFFVNFEARQVAGKPDSFVVSIVSPSRPDVDYLARAARAIELGREDFGPVTRSYNFAALPAQNGEWWVYAMPAQRYWNVWPLGGDTRYRISRDGRAILAKRRLHNIVLEVMVPADTAGKVMKALMHTAVLDTIPEDTDVFHVLTRGVRVPELVMTDKHVYRIETDGHISVVSTAGRDP